ncbi:sugar transferase [Lacticaseibacillus manihotivorans]|uniref:Bacterial sugar transferase n=1 Tax=Lacticaseibacillus manihotivorans DSM 13343 = JCM 12514 TaxID=1423769 RepID=A0A0R1QHG4_9LACO|nr:sugar transferase [Lacticaseibacillus manihotivorans]KRL44294.1 bacterial sugar transferase [Lacticaseibacillus manihotivorans DSM 13343 = JCM 12514]
MSERRSQHVVDRVQLVTATVDDEICLSKEKVALHKGYRVVKRVSDIILSAAGLLVISPILLIVAIAIKVEDPAGPVFFSQMRVGTDGKLFRMYKFRSMATDAEARLEALIAKNEVDGAMFKMKDDPRVTRVGRFIRKISVDELPQLWNVLNGSMSLVGPRPCLPREYEQYTDYDKQRLLVKPGCTGLWQVSGRNHVGFVDMVKLDIYYIQHRSLLGDLKIMFRTVGVMIFPNAAY